MSPMRPAFRLASRVPAIDNARGETYLIRRDLPRNPFGTAGKVSLANCQCGTTLAITSKSMPAAQMVQLLKWAKQETTKRSIGIRDLLRHVRESIDQEVLSGSEAR